MIEDIWMRWLEKPDDWIERSKPANTHTHNGVKCRVHAYDDGTAYNCVEKLTHKQWTNEHAEHTLHDTAEELNWTHRKQ